MVRRMLSWIGGIVMAIVAAAVVVLSKRNHGSGPPAGRPPTIDDSLNSPGNKAAAKLAAAHAMAQEDMDNEASNHNTVADAFNALVRRGQRRD